ncbi:MAG: site-specific integrase [Treponema sp.]|jgi:integrase|nr:site-specific integrase [Treponema sp.]
MGVHIRVKRGKLYLDINCNGRRRWEALGLTVPADKAQRSEIMRLAEVCRSKREAQILSGEWGLIDPIGGKQSLIGYVKGAGGTFAEKALRHLESYSGGGISIGAVTEKWLEEFQEYLLKKGLSRKTASHYYGAVKQALRKAARDRVIPRNPAIGVKGISVPESDRVHLTMEEVQALAAAKAAGELGSEVRKAFLFGCYTGLRVSDLRTLAWGDIQRDPPQINKRQEKTRKKAYVPLHAEAWAIINDKKIHGFKEFVFPLLAVTKANTNKSIKGWAKKAGIGKNISWHTARHTFAVLSLEYGAEIYTVSKLLGHTDVKTTQIYAFATDKMRRDAVNAIPGLDRD